MPLQGLSDHFVSEAIYLADPDGHGIEIYADRPRSIWEGHVAEGMTTAPLDVDALLGEPPTRRASRSTGSRAGRRSGTSISRWPTSRKTIVFYHGSSASS